MDGERLGEEISEVASAFAPLDGEVTLTGSYNAVDCCNVGHNCVSVVDDDPRDCINLASSDRCSQAFDNCSA